MCFSASQRQCNGRSGVGLGRASENSDRRFSFGSDIGTLDWTAVASLRAGCAPLAFTGARLASHWRHFRGEETLSITLWQMRPSGFVVEYSVCTGVQIEADSVVVDSVEEAVTFFEDVCAYPPSPDLPPGSLLACLMQVQRIAHFNQAFSALVGEALADWASLDQAPCKDCLKQEVLS